MFQRSVIPVQPMAVLRALGARSGWLVAAPDVVRVGFGNCVCRIELAEGLSDVSTAIAELSALEVEGAPGPRGSGPLAFASLDFRRDAPGILEVPEYLITQDASGSWLTSATGGDWTRYLHDIDLPDQELQVVDEMKYRPTGEEYAHAVAVAVEILRRKEIAKVVLARSVSGRVAATVDPAAVAQRLRLREPACTVYSLPTRDGRRFVGASPELLVRRNGTSAQCHPLAGTIAIPAHVDPEDYHAWLLGSSKNLHEHALLVDDVVSTLANFYDEVQADSTPAIVTLRTVAHLGTWINAASKASAVAPHGLELLAVLHPTAAVGGIPRREAYHLIQRLEGISRGHYAGPVGWVDSLGDADWWIGIRGVLLRGSQFEAWAGAGIVLESDPIAEREETRDKLASIMSSVIVDRV